MIFIRPEESEILSIGVEYLRIEGAFYCGIGALFLLYGLYRAIQKPGMSLVLTVISLGTRVVLAYTLSAVPAIGVAGIWWSVPIGWFLADLAGLLYYRYYIRKITDCSERRLFHGDSKCHKYFLQSNRLHPAPCVHALENVSLKTTRGRYHAVYTARTKHGLWPG